MEHKHTGTENHQWLLKSQSENRGLVRKTKKASMLCVLFTMTTPSRWEHKSELEMNLEQFCLICSLITAVEP